jgi:hypothetical protein
LTGVHRLEGVQGDLLPLGRRGCAHGRVRRVSDTRGHAAGEVMTRARWQYSVYDLCRLGCGVY